MRVDGNDLAYLWDMVSATRGIASSIAGLRFEDYSANENLRLAVERRVEILGEAARRLSEGFKHDHPELPWRRIIAQRNVLAHQYDDVDDELMWRLVTQEVPGLRLALEAVLTSPPPDDIQQL